MLNVFLKTALAIFQQLIFKKMRLSILGLLACIAISIENDEANAKRGCCLQYSGEVTYLLPNGTSVTGEQSVAKAEVKAWYEANPDAEERATLQFPVQIILEDESVSSINSQEELMAAKAACKGDRGNSNGTKCFNFNGEVTYLLPDGTSVTGEKREVKTAIKAWYEANPDVEERATLQFPIEIIFEDETVSTINSQEELAAAKEACQDNRSGKKGNSGKGNGRSCFEFNGEVTYLLPDGTSITGEKTEVKTEIKAWYEANPEVEERAILQFPVEIILEDEMVTTINSEEELAAAKEACEGERGGNGDGDSCGNKCFEFNGAVTYLLPDGTSITGEKREVKTEIKAWYEANPDVEERAALQFPIEIIYEDETVSTINSEEELEAAKEACQR